MGRALFFPGSGRGSYPRAKTSHDRLTRVFLKLAVLRPVDSVVTNQVEATLDELEITLARLDRYEAAKAREDAP
jgi:hypothetical protein